MVHERTIGRAPSCKPSWKRRRSHRLGIDHPHDIDLSFIGMLLGDSAAWVGHLEKPDDESGRGNVKKIDVVEDGLDDG